MDAAKTAAPYIHPKLTAIAPPEPIRVSACSVVRRMHQPSSARRPTSVIIIRATSIGHSPAVCNAIDQ
jgi:hypothetical protein